MKAAPDLSLGVILYAAKSAKRVAHGGVGDAESEASTHSAGVESHNITYKHTAYLLTHVSLGCGLSVLFLESGPRPLDKRRLEASHGHKCRAKPQHSRAYSPLQKRRSSTETNLPQGTNEGRQVRLMFCWSGMHPSLDESQSDNIAVRLRGLTRPHLSLTPAAPSPCSSYFNDS